MSGLIALLLAFALGFGAAWIWRSKRIEVLQGLSSRLRRERRTLAHRLSQSNGRLDSANYNRKKVEDKYGQLQATHDALESEHAQLVVSYANLKAGGKTTDNQDDWFDEDVKDSEAPGTTASALESVHQAARQADVPKSRPATGSLQDAAMRPSQSGSMRSASDAPSTLSMDDSLMADTLTGQSDDPDSDHAPSSADTASHSLADDTDATDATDATDSVGDLVLPGDTLSGPDEADTQTRLPADDDAHETSESSRSKPATDQGTGDTRARALRDLEAFEAQLSAATRSIGGGGALAGLNPGGAADEALREQVGRQQAEIDRLQEQLAPLLGLPLALSAREAERDRLSEQLAARDQAVLQLQASLNKQTQTEQALRDELETLRARKPATEEKNKKTGKQNKKRKKQNESARHASLRTNAQAGFSNGAVPPSAQDVDHQFADTLISDALPWEEKNAGHAQAGQQPGDARVESPRQYAQAPDQVDNLKEIFGIGPVLERMLNKLGVFQFRQIAAWSDADVEYFDDQLRDFRGRIRRDDWVSGARQAEHRKAGR